MALAVGAVVDATCACAEVDVRQKESRRKAITGRRCARPKRCIAIVYSRTRAGRERSDSRGECQLPIPRQSTASPSPSALARFNPITFLLLAGRDESDLSAVVEQKIQFLEPRLTKDFDEECFCTSTRDTRTMSCETHYRQKESSPDRRKSEARQFNVMVRCSVTWITRRPLIPKNRRGPVLFWMGKRLSRTGATVPSPFTTTNEFHSPSMSRFSAAARLERGLHTIPRTVSGASSR